MIVPPERREEVRDILDPIRRGETIEHYQTVACTRTAAEWMFR